MFDPKTNRVQWGMLTEEEKSIFKKIRKDNCVFYTDEKTWEESIASIWGDNIIYRQKEEPEEVGTEIDWDDNGAFYTPDSENIHRTGIACVGYVDKGWILVGFRYENEPQNNNSIINIGAEIIKATHAIWRKL